MKLRARADEPEATGALLDRFKSELVVIEPPRSVEVLGGKLGHGVGVAQWSGHGRRLLLAGWMNVLTAAGAENHRVTHRISDHWRWEIPLRTIPELIECSYSRSVDRLSSSG